VEALRLYIFKSDAKSELRAFAAEVTGSKLPGQFRGHAIGIVASGKDPPHRFSRQDIESAIHSRLFSFRA
jgi:hypothetical protein